LLPQAEFQPRNLLEIGALSWLAGDTGSGLGAPTARSALEHVAMMEKPVEHATDGSNVAQQFAPVFYGAIGRQ